MVHVIQYLCTTMSLEDKYMYELLRKEWSYVYNFARIVVQVYLERMCFVCVLGEEAKLYHHICGNIMLSGI